MKIKTIMYLCICSMQCIIASDTTLNTKRKRVHSNTNNRNIECHKSIRLKEDNVIIEIPTRDALRKRFEQKNYHTLIKDTPLLTQLTSKQQTCLTIYQIIDEMCSQFYPHTNIEEFLTRLYHKDQIVRIVLKHHSESITKLENIGKILPSVQIPTKTP